MCYWLSIRKRPSRKVLIADDEPHLVRLLRTYFRRAGYEVTATTDSKRILDKARSERPDLILLDVYMPEAHTGCAILQSLIADPLTNGIPVILINQKQAYKVPTCHRKVCCHDPSTVPTFPQIHKPFNPTELVSLAGDVIPMP